jgi:hypothetical protein
MRRTMVGAVVLAALGVLVLAAPVAAFPLTNCTLKANSLAAGGAALDSIEGGAVDATQADPFLVDWDGTITYSGGSDIAMINNTWGVSVFTFPTPLQGGDDNPEDTRTGSGTVGVSANAPFRFTGLYYVSGSLKGSGGTCTGSGWFKLTGDPIGTIPFFGGLGVLILGLVMLAIGARGHTITAIIDGILTGLGATTMLVIYSALPIGEQTPLVVLLVGLILGIAIGLLGRRGGGEKSPPMMPPTNPPTPA